MIKHGTPPPSPYTLLTHISLEPLFPLAGGEVCIHMRGQKGCRRECVVQVPQHLCERHACGNQLFAKVQGPYIYLSVPPPPPLLRLHTGQSQPGKLARLAKPQTRGSLLLKGAIGFIQITGTRVTMGTKSDFLFWALCDKKGKPPGVLFALGQIGLLG